MRRYLTAVAALALLLTSCSSDDSKAAPPATASATTASSSPTTAVSTPTIVATSAPDSFSAPPDAEWLRVTRADGKVQLAAVFRPSATAGPHPVVVVLHGSSGLAGLQLTWAETLAKQGYIVVAGCYLDAAAGSPPGVFLPCAGLPDAAHATAAELGESYRTLVDVGAGLDGAEPGAIAVVGISLGANVALTYEDERAKAIVADSGYRETPGTTKGPVLLLGFTNDPNVPHSSLVDFENAQRATNPVDSHYYDGASHVAVLTADTTADATARTVAFLQHNLP